MRSRHARQRRLDDERRRLEVVGAVGRRPAELVPRPVDGRRADAQRRARRASRSAARTAAARRPRRCPAPGPGRRRGRTARRRRAAAAAAEVVVTRPSAARPRRRPSRRRARRRGGSACRCARRPGARRRPAPGRRGCVPSVGTPAAYGPPTVMPVAARRDRQRVGEVERDHLGVEQVVAVGADAGDRAATASAWPGATTRVDGHVAPTAVPAGPSRRAPSSSGRAVAATPAAANCSARHDAGQRAPQHLAALPERRAHEREQRVRARRRAAAGGRSRRAPTRRSGGARTPTPARRRRSRAVAQ